MDSPRADRETGSGRAHVDCAGVRQLRPLRAARRRGVRRPRSESSAWCLGLTAQGDDGCGGRACDRERRCVRWRARCARLQGVGADPARRRADGDDDSSKGQALGSTGGPTVMVKGRHGIDSALRRALRARCEGEPADHPINESGKKLLKNRRPQNSLSEGLLTAAGPRRRPPPGRLYGMASDPARRPYEKSSARI